MQKTISPITPDQFAKFKDEATKAGINVPSGNSGEVTTHGVTLDFAYDGTNSLVLTIKDKPWYAPASMIWDQLAPYLPA